MYDEPRRACVVIRPGHCYWQNDSKMIRLGCASLWSGGTPPIYSPSNKSHLSFLQEAHTDSCCGYHGNMMTTIRLASTIPNTVNGGDVQSCTYTVQTNLSVLDQNAYTVLLFTNTTSLFWRSDCPVYSFLWYLLFISFFFWTWSWDLWFQAR